MTSDMVGQYRTIYADPPWEERGGGKRGAQYHYPVMTLQEICDLGPGVIDLCHPKGAHLYIWTTNNFLMKAREVIEAWGFTYITCITWFKTSKRFGLGQYFRGKTEQLLFCRRGKVPYKYELVPCQKDPKTLRRKRCQGTTEIFAKPGRHSAKPEEARPIIEHVSHGPFVELFARKKTPGWHTWGNQVPNNFDLLTMATYGPLFAYAEQIQREVIACHG